MGLLSGEKKSKQRNSNNPLDNEIFQYNQNGLTFANSNAVQAYHGAQEEASTYSLMLSIFYETVPGESICVVGSIPELGGWEDLKAHMTWTDGHVWVLNRPVITARPYFSYKYVLVTDSTERKAQFT